MCMKVKTLLIIICDLNKKKILLIWRLFFLMNNQNKPAKMIFYTSGIITVFEKLI